MMVVDWFDGSDDDATWQDLHAELEDCLFSETDHQWLAHYSPTPVKLAYWLTWLTTFPAPLLYGRGVLKGNDLAFADTPRGIMVALTDAGYMWEDGQWNQA